MITEIIRTKGNGYKIIMYLLRSSNPKKNYAAKISREENCSTIGIDKNIRILEDGCLIIVKKIGRVNYLQLTKRGNEVARIICELGRKLR